MDTRQPIQRASHGVFLVALLLGACNSVETVRQSSPGAQPRSSALNATNLYGRATAQDLQKLCQAKVGANPGLCGTLDTPDLAKFCQATMGLTVDLCNAIADADTGTLCRAQVTRNSQVCDGVIDFDLGNFCRAVAQPDAGQCGTISDLDLRVFCQANVLRGSASCAAIVALPLRNFCQAITDSNPAECLGPSCVPETDGAFCQRLGKDCDSVSGVDNCGAARTAGCGACTSPQSCGGTGTGTANLCGCAPESDADFCTRLGLNCDSVSQPDNCGDSRAVTCGACSEPETCGGGGTPNVCGCTPETDEELCTRLGLNCDAVSQPDNCGVERSVTCGTCTDPQTCGGGGTPNVCG